MRLTRAHLLFQPAIFRAGVGRQHPDHVGVGAPVGTLGDAAASISQQIHRHLEDVAADFLGAVHLPGLPLFPGRAGGLIENVGRDLGIAGATLNEQSQAGVLLGDEGFDGGAIQGTLHGVDAGATTCASGLDIVCSATAAHAAEVFAGPSAQCH